MNSDAPPADNTKPVQSSRPGCASRTLAMCLFASQIPSRPIGILMKKIRRQCRYVVMKPPSGGPTTGPEQRGHRQIVDRANEVRLRHRTENDDAAHRHHHRAANALHEARNHERAERGGGRAHQRAGHEDADGRAKHRARTEAVGHPAADRNEDAEADHVGRDGKLEGDGVLAEIARQNGQRRHDDRAVHVFHEHRARDDQRNDESA